MSDRLYRPSDLRIKLVEHEARTTMELAGASRGRALFLLVFALCWNGFLVVWYTIAGATGGGPGGLMFWFPLIHVAVGVFILYAAIRDLLNHVAIRIGETFEFAHTPIPTGRNHRCATKSIEGFRTSSRQPNSRDGVVTWSVELLSYDGTSTRLYLELPSEQHAQYLASVLDEQIARLRSVGSYR